jgi:hypothetical protein
MNSFISKKLFGSTVAVVIRNSSIHEGISELGSGVIEVFLKFRYKLYFASSASRKARNSCASLLVLA